MKTILVCALAITLFSCSPRPTISSGAISQTTPSCTFSGDNGETFRQPVQIAGIESQLEALAAEYHFISKRYGSRGTDWILVRQTLLSEQDRVVDVVEIQLQEPAERKCIYFDASNFIE